MCFILNSFRLLLSLIGSFYICYLFYISFLQKNDIFHVLFYDVGEVAELRNVRRNDVHRTEILSRKVM